MYTFWLKSCYNQRHLACCNCLQESRWTGEVNYSRRFRTYQQVLLNVS